MAFATELDTSEANSLTLVAAAVPEALLVKISAMTALSLISLEAFIDATNCVTTSSSPAPSASPEPVSYTHLTLPTKA